MAPARRWQVFLLICFYIGVFQTYGEDFSLCFIRHRGQYPKQKLVFVCQDDDKVHLNVTWLFDSSFTAITLLKNERHVFDITSPDTNLHATGIENKGFKVTTSGKIHILGHDQLSKSTDMFIPRAHSHLGGHCVVLTHCQDGKPCAIGLVAVEQVFETRVTMILPDTLSEHLEYEGQNYTGGDVICLTLTSQQTFQLLSTADLTGVVIVSVANLAVFAGAAKTLVNTTNSLHDHLMDALPPVNYLGTRYFLVNTDNTYTDYVIASEDSTVLTILACDKSTTLLIEKAFQEQVEFTMVCKYNYISADKDILVGHFLRRKHGNPSLYFPLPVKHFAASYTISSPPISIYTNCKIVLIATSGTQIMYNRFIRITGWNVIPSTEFMYTSFIVPTFGDANTVTDTAGHLFGGYLRCVGELTTAATALMPVSYDILKIPSSTFLRPEDIAALDVCNTTSTETTTSMATTLIDTSTHVAEEVTMEVSKTTEPTPNFDSTTALPDELTVNTLHTGGGNDVTTSPIVQNNSRPCSCPPCRNRKTGNMTVVDLEKFLEEIKSEMLIKKNETSAWKRKLTSAEDRRPSSQGIGLLGSLLLCGVVGIIVLVDVSNYCWTLKRRMKIDC